MSLLPGSITISAGIKSYIFSDNSRATMQLRWESPWSWEINRYNGIDGPTDPRFSVNSSAPNTANIYSSQRAITAQYVVKQNGPFDQEWPCLVQTQFSTSVTNAYYSARFDKYYNKLAVVTPNGRGISVEAYIGPAGLGSAQQIYQFGTELGNEWETGEYSFPVILIPVSNWWLYIRDPVAGFRYLELDGVYGQIGIWRVVVNSPTTLRQPVAIAGDQEVRAAPPESFDLVEKLESPELLLKI